MRRCKVVILFAVLVVSLLIGSGPDLPAGQAAQKNFPENRPARRAAVTKRRRAVQATPAYWVRDILQGYSLDSLLSTSDGGLIVSGWTSSPQKLWFLKFNADGTVAWTAERKAVAEFPGFTLNSMIPAGDGNIVGAGNVATSSVEVAVFKFTPNGQVLWAYSYGGGYVDQAFSISPARDGGFLITGQSISLRGNDTPSIISYYIWIIKIDPQGMLEWERAFACLDENTFFSGDRDVSGVQLADGSFAVAANTRVAGSGEFDYLVIKLDPQGNVEWQKTYGGPQYESLFRKGPHIQPTADGGMVLAGSTNSYGSGNTDIWVLKLASDGDIEWQKAIGGIDYEYCNSIAVAPDGGYVLAGDAGGRFGLIKLTPAGDVEWNRAFGGQYAQAVSIAGDGSIFLGGKYGGDVLIMKTSPQGIVSSTCGFADPPQHIVTNTDAVPVSVSFEPFLMPVGPDQVSASFNKGLAMFTELVCWNLNQAPIPKPLVRTINRGLFRGEAFNTLTWDPHPANAGVNIAQYRIYAKVAGSAAADFRVIGSVPGNYLMYVDPNLDMSVDFEYALTSVDAEGHESPKSVVIKEEFDD